MSLGELNHGMAFNLMYDVYMHHISHCRPFYDVQFVL